MSIKKENMSDTSGIFKVRELYNRCREEKNKGPILDEIEILLEDSTILRRRISLIGLKYDILLQLELKEETVKNYYMDVKSFMDSYPNYNNKYMTIYKIMGNIQKIEYACILLGIDFIAKEDYKKLLVELSTNLEDQLYNVYDDERNNMPEALGWHCLIYSRFYRNEGHDDRALKIFFEEHKKPKFEYYNYTKEEIQKEVLDHTKYDFIWRDFE